MRKLTCGLFLLLFAFPALAQTYSTIQLLDGSSIIGEVVEMKSGIYTIKSSAMGQLTIPADQILSIQSGNPRTAVPPHNSSSARKAPAISEGYKHAGKTTSPAKKPTVEETSGENQASSASPDQASLERAQKEASTRVNSMIMDGEFSEKVSKLDDANAMQEVLNDEETMNAIRSFDYENLMNNEKMKKLMESSEIRDLLGDLE